MGLFLRYTLDVANDANENVTTKLIETLLDHIADGTLPVPIQSLNVIDEALKNVKDHTNSRAYLYIFTTSSKVFYGIFDLGGGPKKPLEWCKENNNTTKEGNLGLGFGWMKVVSEPIGMKIKIIRLWKLYGYFCWLPKHYKKRKKEITDGNYSHS